MRDSHLDESSLEYRRGPLRRNYDWTPAGSQFITFSDGE